MHRLGNRPTPHAYCMPRPSSNLTAEKAPERVRTVIVLTGWKRLLPCYVHRSGDGLRVRVFPRQAFVWLLLLACSAYLGAGTLLFLNDRHRHGLADIAWWDRVYPPHWDRYREARGSAYIALAQASLKAGEFPQALHQARVGLARAPAHLTGRQLLADLYQAMERPDLTETLLVEGLTYHAGDVAYLKRTFAFLFHRQRDLIVIEQTRHLLPRFPSPAPQHTLLATSLAQACFFRGHFDQAEDVLRDPAVNRTLFARLLLSRIEWERGFTSLAFASIEQLARQHPDDATVYRTHVQWLIASDRTDEARRVSLLRRLRRPEEPQPRIDLLLAFDRQQDKSALDREVADYLHDFDADTAALLLLGDFAANTGRPDIARIVFEHTSPTETAAQHGPALMYVESLLTAGRHQEALDLAQTLLQNHPDWEPRLAPVFNGLRAIAFHALGDRESSELYLDSYLRLAQPRAENLVAMANRLDRVGADVAARRALIHAVQSDPHNQAALVRLVELDLESDNAPDLPPRIERLLTMRRPSPLLLRRAAARLSQDDFATLPERDFLLSRINALLTGQTAAETDPRTTAALLH